MSVPKKKNTKHSSVLLLHLVFFFLERTLNSNLINRFYLASYYHSSTTVFLVSSPARVALHFMWCGAHCIPDEKWGARFSLTLFLRKNSHAPLCPGNVSCLQLVQIMSLLFYYRIYKARPCPFILILSWFYPDFI